MQGVGSEENITEPTSGKEDDGTAIYGQIKGTSIVFIKDVSKIWTHGKVYDGSTINVDELQDKLVSGENIKTINGTPILGEGDITIESGYPDANIQAVDIGEEIEDVNIEYVTKDELQDAVENINPAPMVSVTYSELVELRNNSELIAGMQYRITDYATTTVQENTLSAGHPFDVIVTADSADKLNEVARAGFPTFNIERYKDAYSHTLGEDMSYIGLYEYEGKNYHLYESRNNTQMLVDFTETFNFRTALSLYSHEATPAFIRETHNGTWGEWEEGADVGETINFNVNPNSAYFHDAEAKLEAWKIWYCLDNDVERFAWADAENGKGVIYRMIDEWNNDCPYDFKNIMFKRSLYEGGQGIDPNGDADADIYCYTFSWEDEQYVIMDSSIVGNNGYITDDGNCVAGVCNNIIKPYTIAHDYCVKQNLNDIVFLYTYAHEDRIFYGCNNNIFGVNCHYNNFSSDCSNNIFGAHCSRNYLADSSNNNTFGNECSINSLHLACSYNVFSNYCSGNILNRNSQDNYFGENCGYNTLGKDCCYNNFGVRCSHNVLGEGCTYNNYVANCVEVRITDMNGAAKFTCCTFENFVNDFELYYDNEPEYYTAIRNIHVYSGVSGWKEIGDPIDRDYETCYAYDKSGNIREFCIWDFENS